MGTRSTTKIYEEYNDGTKGFLLGMYIQYDGYTDGVGQQLKDFIKKCVIVNGFGSFKPEDKLVCNGVGCFALQLVNELKDGTGGTYATMESDEQEYNYEITFKMNAEKNAYSEIEFVCKDEPEFNQIFKIGDDGVVA